MTTDELHYWLNIAIGAAAGVFLGRVLGGLLDYSVHPDLYAAASAPWYAALWPWALGAGAVVAACAALKLALRLRARRGR